MLLLVFINQKILNMEEVKEEKFGSRKSTLKDLFLKAKIPFITNVWVVTCRYKINSDKNSRYLVCIESNLFDSNYESIVNKINNNVSVIHTKFDEVKKNVIVTNIKSKQTGELNYTQFKNRIIELTKCKYVDSYALGSSESTPLSRFFRENMGKGFALTDIDFYLTEKELFIEEKNFIKSNKGYLGVGQCISFKEIINDIFVNVKLKIICIADGKYYVSDLININCNNTKVISGWGKMVEYEVEPLNETELLNLIK